VTAQTVTIHPLNVKPGDVVVTVISDAQITVTREVREQTPREQVHAILLEVQKRGGGNFVADLDRYTDRAMSVLRGESR